MDKNVLKKFAIESRQELMEKVANKINRYFAQEEFNVNQNGEVYVLVNDKHTLRLTKSEYENRQLLVKRIKEITLEQVIEEAAYTWFNRIIAIRYMEIHDYLPLTKDNQSLGVRVLSSKDNTPDPEIMKISNLINPDLDIEFNKEYYGSIQDNNKRFEYILLLICKKLGKVIPQVFDGITDYIDILIPDNLLNESGYITKLLSEVSEDNFEQVEIIGWLYQYYNQTEKDRVMSEDRSYEKSEIPYVTQLFTPDWVVKYMVENSLGKYWIEHGGNEKLTNNWKYYIKTDKKRMAEKINPQSIKCIDPCSGSGHILVYMFEVLFQIYESYGYARKDIAELILKNNLYGLDIDDRAGQLSVLSVLLKAREYDRFIFNNEVISKLKIMSIQESNSINAEYLNILKKENIDEKSLNYNSTIDYVNDSFKNAKEIGSLAIIDNKNYNEILKNIEELSATQSDLFNYNQLEMIKEKYIPLLNEAMILSNKYNIVVTNPPYMKADKMSSLLSQYINKYYARVNYDLYSSFILQCKNMLKKDGKTALITMHNFMFAPSFKEMRKIINDWQWESLLHLGSRAFSEISGEVVQTCTYVLSNNKEDSTLFYDLTDYKSETEKREAFLCKKCKVYKQDVKDFIAIPGNVWGYALSENIMDYYKKGLVLGKYGESKAGIVTGDDNYFVRLWYEVLMDDINFSPVDISSKYVLFSKGGSFTKWYGNTQNVLKLKDLYNEKLTNKSVRRGDVDFYFKRGIGWSQMGNGVNKNYSEIKNALCKTTTPMFYAYDNNKYNYIIAFLNSYLIPQVLKSINPTLSILTSDILSLPFIYDEKNIKEINNYVEKVYAISKEMYSYKEENWEFKKLFNQSDCVLERQLNKEFDYFQGMKDEINDCEDRINRIFSKLYKMEYIPAKKEIIKTEFIREKVIRLISFSVGCIFGRFSLDEEGIIFTGGVFNSNRYKSFEIDKDNIIPITEEDYFGDDIVSRFKRFIEVAYGKEMLYENLEFIAETLGKKNGENSDETIRRYFINNFYNDHVKIYQKRPIYWLFDSGKKNGFKCLIYMHRYNEGTVSKIRLDYLHRIQNAYEKELKEITDKLNQDIDLKNKRELTKKQVDVSAKLQETNEYDEKIAHIADQRIKIDLDDGVVVNYAKFSVKNPKTGKDESILAKIK